VAGNHELGHQTSRMAREALQRMIVPAVAVFACAATMNGIAASADFAEDRASEILNQQHRQHTNC